MTEIFIPDFIKEFYFKCLTKTGIIHNHSVKKYMTPEIEDYLSNNFSLKQISYIIRNNLQYIPQCKTCGKDLANFHKGRQYCCLKCALDSDITKNKIKTTNIIKYGCENPKQNKDVIEKTKQTCLKRYGGIAPACSKEVQEKMKTTNIIRYGCENAMQNEDIMKKIKQTNLEKYGVENPSQSEEIKEKIKQTNLERYGVENPKQNKQINNKVRKTNRTKHYDTFIKLLEYKSISLDMTKDEYISSDILKFKCNICNNIFETEISNSQYIHCPHCHKEYYSIKEKELLQWIKSIYSGKIIENDRTILKPKELDIYITEKKLAIEYNGNYWHSITNELPHS